MTERKLEIRVPTLSRVEGEGALELDVENNRLRALRLSIYEPPRFFEKLLEGRSHADLPDIEARICGICPVAYQLTAVQAVEAALGVAVPPAAQELRELLYCGEWIQSHSLHIHLLAAPDFLGYEDAFSMGAEHGEVLERGLRLQAAGNRIMEWLGGRSVHPVNVRAGGFYRAPDPKPRTELADVLARAWEDSEGLVRWAAGLPFPKLEEDVLEVCLRRAGAYPLCGGEIVSSDGLRLAHPDWDQRFREFQVPHSTALHALLDDQPYRVGPLSRINLNLDRLSAEVLAPLSGSAVTFPTRNPFHAVVARAVEIRHAVREAQRLLADWEAEAPVSIAVPVAAGVGAAATEAPRGLLWHRYELAADGTVRSARIVPPTSQNQASIEAGLRHALERFGLDRDADDLRRHAEQVIRNYDPCISCATHFLDLRIHRQA